MKGPTKLNAYLLSSRELMATRSAAYLLRQLIEILRFQDSEEFEVLIGRPKASSCPLHLEPD